MPVALSEASFLAYTLCPGWVHGVVVSDIEVGSALLNWCKGDCRGTFMFEAVYNVSLVCATVTKTNITLASELPLPMFLLVSVT